MMYQFYNLFDLFKTFPKDSTAFKCSEFTPYKDRETYTIW